MFVRRGRAVYLRTAPAGSGAPSGDAAGGGAPAPASAPAVPATPAPAAGAFDPANPPAEVKAWLDAERKRIAQEEGGKARDTARAAAAEAAKNDVLKTLAEALGVKPADVDPAKLAAQLDAAQLEVRAAKVDREVGRIARSLHADEDLVGALLERKQRAALAALDPAAEDFTAKIEALVKAEVEANPRLKLDQAPAPTPPGGRAPTANGFQQQPGAGQRPDFMGAIAAHYGGR